MIFDINHLYNTNKETIEIYSKLTNDGKNNCYINNTNNQLYYIGGITLDCTFSREDPNKKKYIVSFGSLHSKFYIGKIPTPYSCDLEEFLTRFSQSSESML